MVNRHMRRCSTSETISEMHIQTTMRYHLIPGRMAVIKTRDNRWWWGCGENGTLIHCWWECKLVQSLWKNNMEFPQKIKNISTTWSSNSTSVYVPQINENRISTMYLHSLGYCSIIYNSQDMETTTQMPINGWMDKKDVVHLHNEILFSLEKGGYLPPTFPLFSKSFLWRRDSCFKVWTLELDCLVWIPAVPLTNHMILGKSLNLSCLFLQAGKWGKCSTNLGLLWRANELSIEYALYNC